MPINFPIVLVAASRRRVGRPRVGRDVDLLEWQIFHWLFRSCVSILKKKKKKKKKNTVYWQRKKRWINTNT